MLTVELDAIDCGSRTGKRQLEVGEFGLTQTSRGYAANHAGDQAGRSFHIRQYGRAAGDVRLFVDVMSC